MSKGSNLWSTPNPLKVSTVCRTPGTAWLGSLADPAFGVLSRWEIGFIHSIGRSVQPWVQAFEGDIEKQQFLQDILFMFCRHFQRMVIINRNVLVPTQHFTLLKSFVES